MKSDMPCKDLYCGHVDCIDSRGGAKCANCHKAVPDEDLVFAAHGTRELQSWHRNCDVIAKIEREARTGTYRGLAE